MARLLGALAFAFLLTQGTQGWGQGLRVPSPEELDRIVAMQRATERAMSALPTGLGAAPRTIQCSPQQPSFDLRQFGIIQEPRRQGCDDCYIFASAGAIETTRRVFNVAAKDVKVSEQELLDCNDMGPHPAWTQLARYDCTGGFFDGPFGYADTYGVLSEGGYTTANGETRYVGQKLTCMARQPGDRVSLFSWSFVRGVLDSGSGLRRTPIAATRDLKQALCDTGGVVTAIDIAAWDRSSFQGPLIAGRPTNADSPWYSPGNGHAVQIVGWDDTYPWTDLAGKTGQGVWIIKNSWGPFWGEGGFVRIPYDHQSIGLVAAWAKADLVAALASAPPTVKTEILNAREVVRAVKRQGDPAKIIRDLEQLGRSSPLR